MLPWKESYQEHLCTELHLTDPPLGKGGKKLLEGAALLFSALKSGFQVLLPWNFTSDVHSGAPPPLRGAEEGL